MTCPAYGSTSGVALYFTTDTAPADALAATLTWNEIPFTNDSLSANLTAVVSERITSARAYADSTPSKGEVSGSLSYEAEAGAFLNAMLQAVLQASGTWAAAGSITNGSTPTCLAILKTVARSGGTDYYVYRGVQVNTLSLKVSPGALVTGEIGLMGLRPGSGALGATDGSNDVLTSKPAGWTLTPVSTGSVMSAGYALQDFEIQNAAGTDMGVVVQELSMEFNNALRAQDAIGIGVYSAGVASGRFEAKLNCTAYYTGPGIINALQANENLKIVFSLYDESDAGWSFRFDKVKPLNAPSPQAGGADQDLTTATEFQAFQSDTYGTVTITRSA